MFWLAGIEYCLYPNYQYLVIFRNYHHTFVVDAIHLVANLEQRSKVINIMQGHIHNIQSRIITYNLVTFMSDQRFVLVTGITDFNATEPVVMATKAISLDGYKPAGEKVACI